MLPLCVFSISQTQSGEILSSAEEIISAKQKFSRRKAKFAPCLVG